MSLLHCSLWLLKHHSVCKPEGSSAQCNDSWASSTQHPVSQNTVCREEAHRTPGQCPGRVVRGEDTLHRSQQELRIDEQAARKHHVQSLAPTNIRAPGRLQEQHTAQFPRGLAQHGGWTGASPVPRRLAGHSCGAPLRVLGKPQPQSAHEDAAWQYTADTLLHI